MSMGRDTSIVVGLVDADLLAKGTRHPNLALLKIAGFLFDNNIPFELILDSKSDISRFGHIFMSRVFSFTPLPEFYTRVLGTNEESKFHVGGTGFYAAEKDVKVFSQKRRADMHSLEEDLFLSSFPNHRGGEKLKGIDMARQMPYYHLYDAYVEQQVQKGFKRERYKDYQQYSIGFLTRGCIRHCPFCINKLEKTILPYSRLDWFLDKEVDENGKKLRPYIYLWDDNFLASDYSIWKPLLQELIDRKQPFQFRQGLDERMLAQSEHGKEMALMLSKAKYHGDFIFAFDNWKDRDVIEKALKIWKHYNPKKSTKFYLFCGFMLTTDSHERFYRDIWELFQRIKILMSYGCVGYIMRHEDYHKYELSNLYVQIARWCNQQAFYKKMSFWEFCYRNQSYWEEKYLKVVDRPAIKSFADFMDDVKSGYYQNIRMCLPLKTILATLEKFPEHSKELMDMFNYKMSNLQNPILWE